MDFRANTFDLMRIARFGSALILYQLLPVSCWAATYSPEKLEKGFTSHRAKIGSGQVEIRREYKGNSSRHEVIFSEEGYRGDSFLTSDDTGQEFRKSVAFPAETGQSLYFNTETYNGGGSVAASIRRDTRRQRLLAPLDPRLIGSRPLRSDLMVGGANNAIVGNALWDHPETAEKTEVAGIQAWKIEYRKGDVNAAAWFLPTRDFNIAKMTVEQGDLIDEFNCSLQQIEGYGWFPLRLEYHRTEAGATTIAETLQIKVLHFNSEVSGNLFTLAGMGVPDGYVVFDRTGPGGLVEKTLRDGKLIAKPQLTPFPTEPNASGFGGKRFALLSVGFGLALLAAFFLIRSPNAS